MVIGPFISYTPPTFYGVPKLSRKERMKNMIDMCASGLVSKSHVLQFIDHNMDLAIAEEVIES